MFPQFNLQEGYIVFNVTPDLVDSTEKALRALGYAVTSGTQPPVSYTSNENGVHVVTRPKTDQPAAEFRELAARVREAVEQDMGVDLSHDFFRLDE